MAVTLREVIQGQSKQRQHVAQLLAQARDLLGRGELDESLKRIEEGLSSASEQSDFLALRDQVKTAIATNNRIGELLRDCATRFPLDRLTDQQGSEVAACYNQILALSPDHGQARARLEQVADRYADLANGALDKADFRLADAYLAQLARIRPDHARLASLNRTLRSKREQAAIEARRMLESEAKRRAADEAKRQAAEEAKRRASATLPTTPPANPPATNGKRERPRTGVEIVESQERDGTIYHTLRDLRSGNLINNVTRSSARRLWHYAITQAETAPPDLGSVQWRQNVAVLNRRPKGNSALYDLAVRDDDGVHVYYGVTDSGLSEEWLALVEEPRRE